MAVHQPFRTFAVTSGNCIHQGVMRMFFAKRTSTGPITVSYTHLTLPTIYSV